MSEPAAVTEPAAPPAPCPKCGLVRQPAAAACTRCGLVFANWKPEASASVATIDAEGEALWAATLAAWDDEAKHDAFLKHCVARGALGAAGRRYRERVDQNPSDTVAARRQEKIIQMATLALGPIRSAPPEPVTRQKWFWVVMIMGMLVGVTLAFMRGRR